jgi:Na+-driven multidrug efflux pump
MAFLAGLYLKMELPAVYLLIGAEELFKTILIIFRFKSGKWLKDLRRRN